MSYKTHMWIVLTVCFAAIGLSLFLHFFTDTNAMATGAPMMVAVLFNVIYSYSVEFEDGGDIVVDSMGMGIGYIIFLIHAVTTEDFEKNMNYRQYVYFSAAIVITATFEFIGFFVMLAASLFK